MNKKIKEIIEALEFMCKTGDVSKIALESLKNGLEELAKQLILSGVVKSFTAEQVVNELKENETLDDAISFFNSQKQQYMFYNVKYKNSAN